ncbi:AMMECR1 domain-containing protein [Hamadaea tsunoensis]|uniref:AMMECR1 domain-containing protein n=1 Tax=Hamadaea tsunoensis TaxID=53368 RepID=UPI0004008CEF|nr:AMMECR1 domain-containing protein [Hamadaea tsunoensis]
MTVGFVRPVVAPPDVRSRLRELLRQDGILWAGPGQPVVDRRGETAPWMFYSWGVSLTADGARLAGENLLAALSGFDSTQLATFGTTGIPLVTACVLLGGGRYTGICVRPEPKGGPGGRQIEGVADPSRPVVLIDDSLSSGRSFLSGARVLEQQGFTVEGTICLVHFPHRGGRERAEALGYRVETLFDVWADLGMAQPIYVPGFRRVGDFPAAGAAAPEGLAPAVLARVVAERLLDSGELLTPPATLDKAYEAGGGTWVSFRDRATDTRPARDGFWHFEPADADPARDVVLATAKTVRNGGLTRADLDRLKLAVTFFGPLERITPGGVDFARYGLLVQSRAWPVKLGGALPNTQVFTSDREQLDLALRNARLAEHEPYDLYRHDVRKYPEPGGDWLPYGVPDGPGHAWTRSPAVGEALTARAVEVVRALLAGHPVPTSGVRVDGLVPVPVSGVGITLYRQGVVGCAVSHRAELDEAVVAAATAALGDRRFTDRRPDPADLSVCVSVLFDPERLRSATPAYAARKMRLGRDSIAVAQGGHQAILLESVGPHYDWTKPKVVERLLAKAGAGDGPADWTTYRTATWLGGPGGTVSHQFGFAEPPGEPGDAELREDLLLLGGYLAATIDDTGLPLYAQTPVPGWRWTEGSTAREIHGLSGLDTAGRLSDRSGWTELARGGLRTAMAGISDDAPVTVRLAGHRGGPMGDSELLAAVSDAGLRDAAPERLAALADRVESLIRDDGSVHPDGQPVRLERDNDYLPSAVVLALARFRQPLPGATARRCARVFDAQLARFRRVRRWGQAGWLPQAGAALWDATGDPRYAGAAFEVADWALDWQSEATGAFLTDLSPDGPGFHTAFVAEAVADAARLAIATGDTDRAVRYARSWREAMRLCRRLILRPADAPCLSDPDRQIGGVRASLTSGTVRVDYVSHLIIAIAKGLSLPPS